MIRVIHFVNMKKRRILGTYGTFKKQQVPTFTLSLIIFAITYFREFPEFWSILQNQIHAKFSFKQHSRKKIHAKYPKIMIFCENKFTEKNIHKKCWLIRLFFGMHQQQQFFHRHLPVFPLIVAETIVKCPLIQLPFSDSFVFELKFINSKFSKAYHSRK